MRENTHQRPVHRTRTFGSARPVSGPDTGRVRLTDALLCPQGIELQTVTLINRGKEVIRLNGWKLMDSHGRTEALDGLVLAVEGPLTVTISGLGARFGNRGGSILLVDDHGQVVHIARYTRRMTPGGRATGLLG